MYNPKEVLRVAVMVGFGNPESLYNIDQVKKHKQWDGTWSSFPGKHLILIWLENALLCILISQRMLAHTFAWLKTTKNS